MSQSQASDLDGNLEASKGRLLLFSLQPKREGFSNCFSNFHGQTTKTGTTVTPPQIWPKAADKRVADLKIILFQPTSVFREAC